MPSPIQAPSGYSVSRAVAFADIDGTALLVSSTAPLPVTMGQAGTTPLAGSTATSGIAGPFTPVLGRPVILSLQGSWTGTVKVVRSTDGGTTKLALTVGGTIWAQFSGNCCEPVWDESDASARLYLDITLASGSVTYRLAQ